MQQKTSENPKALRTRVLRAGGSVRKSRRASAKAQAGAMGMDLSNRETLLLVAKGLFAKKGYDGVTVREIADQAQVNLGLISYYFGGKLGIYREVIRNLGSARLDAVRKILKEPQSRAELALRLEIFSTEIIESNLLDPDTTEIAHREVEHQTEGAEDVFRRTFVEIFNSVEDFIRTAHEKGLVREGVDPHSATQFLFGNLVHWTRMDRCHHKYFGKTLRDPAYRAGFIRGMIDFYTRGLQ